MKTLKMKKLISIIILIASLFLKSYSQANFSEGYVIMNNNDTIFGLIKNNGKKENSIKCVFKYEPEGERTTYYPDDIKSYKFTDGNYYISRKLNTNDSEPVFLEFLFDGIVDLYYYYDALGDHYYITKNGSDLSILQNESVEQIVNGQKYTRNNNAYIGTLKTFYTDSPNTMKKVESISLNHNSLIQVAENYHSEVCPDEECVAYSKRKIKPILSFGPIIGVTSSKFFIDDRSRVLGRFDSFQNSTTRTGITLGGFINIQEPFISKNISIQLEAFVNQTDFSNDIAKLKISTLKIPLLLKYTLQFKKIQPSSFIGFGYNHFLLFDYYLEDYDYMHFTSGKSLFSLLGGLETAIKFNSRNSAFIQLNYEYCLGQSHYGEWDDMGWKNSNTRSFFFTYFNNISIVTGFKF